MAKGVSACDATTAAFSAIGGKTEMNNSGDATLADGNFLGRDFEDEEKRFFIFRNRRRALYQKRGKKNI